MLKTTSIIIYCTLAAMIISYSLVSLVSTSSLQYHHHAYGQTTDSTDDALLTIDGIECARTEQLAFHTHTQLNITINNQSYPIPAGIGIIPNHCIYWVHTHDDGGVIHIESPIEREFTLGQFLRLWYGLNSSDVVVQNLTDNTVNGTLSVYLNNIHVNTNNTDYRDLVLRDQSQISLIISER